MALQSTPIAYKSEYFEMRVFGGKDYYDVGLSMGIDPTITLLREKSRSIPVGKAGGSLLSRRLVLKPEHLWMSTVLYGVAVVFCDKVFRGAMIAGPKNDEGIWSAEKIRAWAYQEKNREIEVRNGWSEEKMTLEQYFTPFEAPKKLRDYMIANKISILIERVPRYNGDEHVFEVNQTGLKQLGFAKALDPYTAFQELSMWIGGVLGGTSPEIVTIKDDRTLLEGHGFDNRFSFRGPRIA